MLQQEDNIIFDQLEETELWKALNVVKVESRLNVISLIASHWPSRPEETEKRSPLRGFIFAQSKIKCFEGTKIK